MAEMGDMVDSHTVVHTFIHRDDIQREIGIVWQIWGIWQIDITYIKKQRKIIYIERNNMVVMGVMVDRHSIHTYSEKQYKQGDRNSMVDMGDMVNRHSIQCAADIG